MSDTPRLRRRHRQNWNVDNIDRSVDRGSWYDSVVDAYDSTRPRYPAGILTLMQARARLQPHKSVLEIGAGPGIVSVELAKLGVDLVCIEPSLSACKLARSKCAAYSNVEFINTTFEESNIGSRRFDAVIAATSYHWISPEVRTIKIAAALKDNGLLILLWNTPPQPNYKVFQSIEKVYQERAPELAKYEKLQNYQQSLTKLGREVIESGYFKDLTTEQLVSEVTYSIDNYIMLLSTLSPYIKLESTQRYNLLAELKRVFELNYGKNLDLSYLSLMQIAAKI